MGYNVRRREKVVSGGATITKNCQGYNFQDFISLLEKLGYIGPLNFQFKLKDSMPIIFDVNTRLASGGLALTVKSGFDIPQLIIANSLGDENEFENAGVWSLSEKNKNLTMIKYYEETYF